MFDPSIELCSIKLRNPIIAAPAGITETADRLKRAEDAGCGAAVIKSYFEYEPARHSPTPRFRVISHNLERHHTFALYSFEQANVYGIEEFGEQIRQAKEMCAMPIFSSLNCNTDERWAEGCQVSEQAGADAIELNVSCPHGTHIMAHVDMLETMAHAVRVAKAATKLPIIPKMSGQLDAPARVAHGLAQAGADGVVMFNRFTGLDIDLETEMPIMHGGYAGHGGPWAIHYVLRWISEISPKLPIPILASGGVAGGEDAVKQLLAGAQAVEVCTAIVMEGWGVVERTLKEMADFAEDKGYASVADFRGKVCARIKGNDQIDRVPCRVAHIAESACVNCGLCARVCIYGAAQKGDGVHFIAPEKCVGCGLCPELCPVEAITLKATEPRPFELGVR